MNKNKFEEKTKEALKELDINRMVFKKGIFMFAFKNVPFEFVDRLPFFLGYSNETKGYICSCTYPPKVDINEEVIKLSIAMISGDWLAKTKVYISKDSTTGITQIAVCLNDETIENLPDIITDLFLVSDIIFKLIDEKNNLDKHTA